MYFYYIVQDTSLGIACIKGSTEVVEMLLKRGADITHINKQKVTVDHHHHHH